MIVRKNAHELVELDIIQHKGYVKHLNSKYLQSAIDGNWLENFEGEYDIYEISYIKHMTVLQQKYEKACILRGLQKKMMGIS